LPACCRHGCGYCCADGLYINYYWYHGAIACANALVASHYIDSTNNGCDHHRFNRDNGSNTARRLITVLAVLIES
jgi:hypothetical protein